MASEAITETIYHNVQDTAKGILMLCPAQVLIPAYNDDSR